MAAYVAAEPIGSCTTQFDEKFRQRNFRVRLRTDENESSVSMSNAAVEKIHLRTADERRHKSVGGRVVDFLRRRDLMNRAVAHDGDAMAERHRFLLIVRHEDHRRAELRAEHREFVAHLSAKRFVEVGEGFV